MDDEKLWFRRSQPTEQAEHRLVCFPHAGGAASYFTPVARALAPDVDVLAVQYPGRQDRRSEPGIDDIGVLADRVHDIIRTWPSRPLTLFGHSMGAVVAFEVARRLRRDNPHHPCTCSSPAVAHRISSAPTPCTSATMRASPRRSVPSAAPNPNCSRTRRSWT
ncbi:thioesterase II family protein [Nocardia terpenica]|uniref:thioesterase II family protein n=1 Tax=Nocardia terpenica TaxID=455432 RepID=UPI001EE9B66C|nr:alpha/beta fold hydrolase [Nocardia terpenica]